MTIAIPWRSTGAHRLSPSELRDENRRLRAIVAGTDAAFALLRQSRREALDTVDRLRSRAIAAEGRAGEAEQQLADQTAELRELRAFRDNALAVTVPPMERDTTDGADQATQPIDVREIQARFADGPVVSLHHSPLADSGT